VLRTSKYFEPLREKQGLQLPLLPLEKPSCGSDGIVAMLYVEYRLGIGSMLVDLYSAAAMLAMRLAEALPTVPLLIPCKTRDITFLM
jgi:hypothetical protein